MRVESRLKLADIVGLLGGDGESLAARVYDLSEEVYVFMKPFLVVVPSRAVAYWKLSLLRRFQRVFDSIMSSTGSVTAKQTAVMNVRWLWLCH